MNILTAIRRNWVWTSLCLLLFTISCSRNFPGLPPLSWWNACWIFLPFALCVFAGGNDWYIARPFRWLAWINTRDHIESKFKKLDKNPMVYPALIWLHLGEAERAFINGGWPAFNKAFDAQTETTKGALIDMVKQASTCGCHDEGCGCHGDKQAI